MLIRDLRSAVLRLVHFGPPGIEALLPLVLALWLRLWQIDLTPFDREQSVLLENAAHFVATGSIPLTSGLAFTAGPRHPPLITFLLALPMLVTRDPTLVTAFQALIDGFGTVFVYLAVRDLAGRWAGLAGGMLYAVSPAAVFYSRLLWNPELVPFLCAVALWGAVGFLRFGDSRRLASAMFAAVCAVQLHLSAISVVPLLLVLALVRRRDLRWRPLAVAAGLFALIIAPYAWLLISSNWRDVCMATVYLTNLKPVALAAPYLALSLVVGDLRRQTPRFSQSPDWSLAADPAVWITCGLIAVGGAIALRQRGAWLLPAWLLLPVLLAFRGADTLFPYYLLPVLPAAAALGGLGVTIVRPRFLAVAILTAIVSLRLVDDIGFKEAMAEVELGAQFGMPLRYSQQAAKLALDLNEDGRLFLGQAPGYGDVFDGAVFSYLTDHRFLFTRYDSRIALVLRRAGGLYLTYGEGHAAQTLAEGFGPPVASVRTPSGRAVFSLFRVTPAAVPLFLHSLPLQEIDADLGHVLRVRGYEHSALIAGRPGWVMLAWDITQRATGRWSHVHLFGHLYDAHGRVWSTNPDREVFPEPYWEPGDFVLSWLDVNPLAATPRGGYWLEMGFYQPFAVEQDPPCQGAAPIDSGGPIGPLLERLPVYEGGTEIGSALRLGPIKVAGPSPSTAGAVSAVFDQGRIALGSVKVAGSQVILTWQALARPGGDYTVFVHGLDAQGNVVAQHDGPPVGGSYPTVLWDAEEVIEDSHPVAGDMTRAVELEIGLYTRPSLERVPAAGPDGIGIGDRFVIRLGEASSIDTPAESLTRQP